jgi:hypothetical protein
MTARTYAALFGGIYLAIGLLGFVPMLWGHPPAGPRLRVNVFYASLFGVFATNIILNMVHLVIGLWGTMSANNRYSALVFTRAGCVILAVLGIAAIIPVNSIRTVGGTVPLSGGYNEWLYLVSAAIALIFAIRPGYALTQIGVQESINPHIPHA